MALPLIPIIFAAGSAVLAAAGIRAGHRGKRRFKEAEGKCAAANELLANAKQRLESQRTILLQKADVYRGFLAQLHSTTFHRAANALQRFGGARGGQDYVALSDVTITTEDLASFEKAISAPAALLEGSAKGVAMGAMASQSAVAAITLYGSASTGASIAGLSGAAANSATLAWLGGGAVAAGGGGVAIGTIVLGGVAIGPAIAAGGWVLGAKGERALTEATAYVAQINQSIERLEVAAGFLEQVGCQVDERRMLLNRLGARANNAIDKLSPGDASLRNHSDASALHEAMLLVKAMSEIMRAPVLDPDSGKFDSDGLTLVALYEALLD